MNERLAGLDDEYRAIEARLGDQDVISDPNQLRDLNRRYKELGAVVEVYRQYRSRLEDLTAAKELLVEASGDERELAREEVAEAEVDLARLEDRLKVLLLPQDPNDGKAVIVEIRGAEGGEEANLFARDLFDMYQAYAIRAGWKLEVLSADPSRQGRFQPGHLRGQGRQRLEPHEVRGWSAPRAAGAGHREPGAGAHVVGHRDRAARGRRGRRRHRPE